METKQTAVEWLYEKITQNGDIRWRGTQYRELFKQAKAMEKEQILEAGGVGFNDGQAYMDGKAKFRSIEHYYNETYGTPVDKKG